MEQITPDMNAFINDLMTHFAAFLKARLSKALRRNVSDGELRSSIETVLTQRDNYAAVSLIFADYGRYIDMKRRNQNPPAPLAAIEDWIDKKGINTFSYVNGYKEGRFPLDREKVKRRIALGITHRMVKHQPARRKWYSRNTWKSIAYLIRLITEGMTENVKNQITRPLKTK